MQSDISGDRLGKYVLKRILGRGGMGEVYEALDPETGRIVAIKVLPANLSIQPGYLERFNQELKLAATLEHIHILPIYDHGSENGTTYIVMRYLTGSDLQNRLHKLGRPSTADARKLLMQVGLALDYAHHRGIVHRDLKPNNIMFDDQGNAYLGDFGIAKVIGTGSGLTGTGQIVGTPYYMAPEQVKADEVDARADIYSLGIIAFQLLTGELPFNAPTPYAVMYKHISDPPPLLTEIQGNLDPRVDEIIHRALAKDPDDRYQAAREFVQDLDAVLINVPDTEQSTGFMTVQVDTTDSELTYTPPSTPKSSAAAKEHRSRLPFGWLAALLAVISIVVFAAVVLTGDEESDPESTDANNAVAQASDTPEASPTDALTPLETPTLSETDTEATVRSEMGLAVEDVTSTHLAGLTQTATLWTSTPTFDPRATANARLTATQQQQIALNLTATATLWTNTPTPTVDISATFSAFNTARAGFTDTPTIDVSATFAAFNTARAGISATPTVDVSATFSAFNTVRAGFTDTPTVDVSATFEALRTSIGAENATEVSVDSLSANIVANSNAEWEPVVQEFDGVEMVLVPAGCFRMGSDDDLSDEGPAHEYCFDEPFWIDRYEVHQEEFAQLGGIQADPPDFSGDTNPVEDITWIEARSFCEMRNGRLPTEAEWEYAVRGPDSLILPWGNEFESEYLVWAGRGGRPQPVGSRPDGVSWVGAYDLIGNVWEWTSSIYMDYPYAANDGRENGDDITSPRVLRGNSWNSTASRIRASYRVRYTPDTSDSRFGFRCVRNYP